MSEVYFPPDLQARLNQAWRAMEDATNKRLADQAKADPKTNKLCRVMEGKHGMSYYWIPVGVDGRGRKVYFCWTKHRNVAGYFLGWRQVDSGRVIKRDQWIARKAKWRAKEVAERRAEAFRAKYEQPA